MSEKPDMAALQAWFGRVISRPLPDEYPGNPLAISAADEREKADSLLKGGTVSGFNRIGIYNQQYWFRLISLMQGEYACAVHVLSLRKFNNWAVRYLEAHPPDSPYLTYLDAAFPGYLEAEYHEPDREAVIQAAAYDRAFSKAVDAPDGDALRASASAPDAMRLCLAPHATPLQLDWDFATYRAACLGDESLEERFELAPGPSFYMVYRHRDLGLRQDIVTSLAYQVLRELREPALLSEVFDRLLEKLPEAEFTGLESGLADWFKEWVDLGWICSAQNRSA